MSAHPTAQAQAAPRALKPAAGTAPAFWPFAPLTAHQQQRHAAQARALRAGTVARWPAGCTHLPGVPS